MRTTYLTCAFVALLLAILAADDDQDVAAAGDRPVAEQLRALDQRVTTLEGTAR